MPGLVIISSLREKSLPHPRANVRAQNNSPSASSAVKKIPNPPKLRLRSVGGAASPWCLGALARKLCLREKSQPPSFAPSRLRVRHFTLRSSACGAKEPHLKWFSASSRGWSLSACHSRKVLRCGREGNGGWPPPYRRPCSVGRLPVSMDSMSA